MLRRIAFSTWLALAVPAALVVVSSRAVAQDAPADTTVAAQDADVARRARESFESGVRHFEARAYREAIHDFLVAAELVPSADLWFNVARAHEELGEWDQAIEHYRRYLRDRVDPPDRARIEAHLVELGERAETVRAARLSAPTTGTLGVRVDVDGAAIRIDDADSGASPLEGDLSVAPGEHALRVSRDGYLPFRAEVGVEPGARATAWVTMQPETRYRAVHGDRVFTWIALGLAGASAGAAIGLGVQAGSLQSTDLASAREWGAFSDAAVGAAIGFSALALILWFVEGRAVGTEIVQGPPAP